MGDDMKIGRARFDPYPPEAGQDKATARSNEAALSSQENRRLRGRLAQAETLLRRCYDCVSDAKQDEIDAFLSDGGE